MLTIYLVGTFLCFVAGTLLALASYADYRGLPEYADAKSVAHERTWVLVSGGAAMLCFLWPLMLPGSVLYCMYRVYKESGELR